MYRLEKADIQKASVVLGEAFQDYPIFKYIIPDVDFRKENLKYVCQFLLNLGGTKGEVIGTSDQLEGVSIWIPSRKSNRPEMEALQAGLLGLFVHLSPGSIRRLMDVGGGKAKKRSEFVSGEYVICDMIGIDPRFQRKGLGGKLIGSKLAEIDKASVPCYLETSRPENVEYYKRHQFEKIGEYAIHGVDVFCMVREPRKR